jgi:pimeloyl-ACP methyl ester carboxylesterase
LLIAAENAPPYFQPAVRDARVALLRDARVRVLPGHHHLHLDHPAAAASALRAFLAD